MAVALERMVVLPSFVSEAASVVGPPSTPCTRCSMVPDATSITLAVAAGEPTLVTPVSSGVAPGIVATLGRLRPGTVVVATCATAGMVRHSAAADTPKTREAQFDQFAIITLIPNQSNLGIRVAVLFPVNNIINPKLHELQPDDFDISRSLWPAMQKNTERGIAGVFLQSIRKR